MRYNQPAFRRRPYFLNKSTTTNLLKRAWYVQRRTATQGACVGATKQKQTSLSMKNEYTKQ